MKPQCVFCELNWWYFTNKGCSWKMGESLCNSKYQLPFGSFWSNIISAPATFDLLPTCPPSTFASPWDPNRAAKWMDESPWITNKIKVVTSDVDVSRCSVWTLLNINLYILFNAVEQKFWKIESSKCQICVLKWMTLAPRTECGEKICIY